MSTTNTINLGATFLKFTFTDADGDVIAFFRLNPADFKLVARCQEVSAFFENAKDTVSEKVTLEDIVKWNDELEEKICYLLGYDAREGLFGQISATTILPDGDLFATKVFQKAAEAAAPEIDKRQMKMRAAMDKHTAKHKA